MATQQTSKATSSATSSSATPKPTPATQWKKSGQGVALDVPSGNTALVRNVGMQVFLTRGLVPNSLMPLVRKAMSGKELDLKVDDITEDQLTDMLALFDAVTVYCVVEPAVLPVPADGEERDSTALYVDEVDFDDKQFIFQWVVGGTKDLEKFRAEQAASVESVRRGATVAGKAE